jgi:hypothetical protein
MARLHLTGLLALSLVACSGDGLSRHSLASGTRVSATIQGALSSRTNVVGDTLQAIVSANVTDARDSVVIPAGSTVLLTVAQLEPGSDRASPQGRLALVVSAVTVHAQPYPVKADLEPVPHHLEGRGAATDAANTSYRDVVVSAGTPIVFTLAQPLNVSVR